MKLKAKPDDLPLLCYALSQAGAKTEAQYPFRYSEVRTHLVPRETLGECPCLSGFTRHPQVREVLRRITTAVAVRRAGDACRRP